MRSSSKTCLSPILRNSFSFPTTRIKAFSRAGNPVSGACFLSGLSFFREHSGFGPQLAAFESSASRVGVRFVTSGGGFKLENPRTKLVSGNYFAVLGVKPFIGRLLVERDDLPGAPPSVVLSYGYWTQRFHGDPDVVGQTLTINGISSIITGVTSREFFGESVSASIDFWLPLAAQPQVTQQPSFLNNPNIHWLNMVGRLPPGVSQSQVEVAANVSLRQILTDRVGPHPLLKTRECWKALISGSFRGKKEFRCSAIDIHSPYIS